MGGRGMYSRTDKWEYGEVSPLHVAGMNRDIAAGVSAGKSLEYLEKVYKKGMTKEQFQVLDDYGFVTRAFQGDEHSVGVDVSTVKYARGRIGTHNHPSGFGGTFSQADVEFLAVSGMKEMRASAREGVYSLKRTGRALPGEFARAYGNAETNLRKRMIQVTKRVENRRYSATVKRRLAVNVLHRWFQKNAEKFGYEYKFEKDKSYKIR